MDEKPSGKMTKDMNVISEKNTRGHKHVINVQPQWQLKIYKFKQKKIPIL